MVSGRPVDFLVGALRIGDGRSPLDAYGLYGAEHVAADGSVTRRQPSARWRAVLELVAGELRAELASGVEVETKQVSTVLHWRGAPGTEPLAVHAALGAAVRHGLELRMGKMSAELLAPGAADKGDVVRELADGARATCFLGDDIGDVPAFVALAELARSGRGRTWRLAVGGPEAPHALVCRADATLDGPAAACAFLAALADRI